MDQVTLHNTPEQKANCAPKYIKFSEIIKYLDKGLNPVEISKLVGCSHQAIYARLQRNNIDVDEFMDFRHNPDIYFEELQFRIMDSISNEDIKRNKAHSRVVDIAILEDKKRTIRGQATQVIDYSAVSREVEELEKRIAAYEERERNTITIPQDIVSEGDDNNGQKAISNDIKELGEG